MLSPSFAFSYTYKQGPTIALPLTPRSANTPSPRHDFMNSASLFSFSKPATPYQHQAHILMPPSPSATPAFGPNFHDGIGHPQSNDKAASPPAPFSFSSPTITSARPSRRTTNQNPLSRSSEDRRKRRREDFLGGVKYKRDEDVFEGRGDRLLYLDHVSEQRAWELAQANAAPPMIEDEVEDAVNEEMDLGTPNTSVAWQGADQQAPQSVLMQQQLQSKTDEAQPDAAAAALDALLESERRELEALVEMHEAPPQTMSSASPTRYWDSDEDNDMDFEDELWRLGEGLTMNFMNGHEDDMDIDLSQG